MIRAAILVLLLTSGVATLPFDAGAQTTTLESLLAEADSASPRIAAARSVADGAAARVPQAGALPDPMLGIGVMNLPVTDPAEATGGTYPVGVPRRHHRKCGRMAP